MGSGNYYRDAMRRVNGLYRQYGDSYFKFYNAVSNLIANLRPGSEIVIDDYCNPSRHEEFCDVVTVYEYEQPFGDGEGLVYLSADRQRVIRGTVPSVPLDCKPKVWLAAPIPEETVETDNA